MISSIVLTYIVLSSKIEFASREERNLMFVRNSSSFGGNADIWQDDQGVGQDDEGQNDEESRL